MAEPVIRTGMFGAQTTGDTSGYGRLRVHQAPPIESPRPYGSYFDEVADALGGALEAAGLGFSDAIERVVVDRGEITFHVRRERLIDVAPFRTHATRDWREAETWLLKLSTEFWPNARPTSR